MHAADAVTAKWMLTPWQNSVLMCGVRTYVCAHMAYADVAGQVASLESLAKALNGKVVELRQENLRAITRDI